ncbi:unnamed protein product [Vicia faba]|uniref:Uncharacterized protein n=1 Tax=Vicia faba TaxID=3906 RepID=A0AAV0YQ66_VICFA|nr:unnamed protein product [Vicia faba]
MGCVYAPSSSSQQRRRNQFLGDVPASTSSDASPILSSQTRLASFCRPVSVITFSYSSSKRRSSSSFDAHLRRITDITSPSSFSSIRTPQLTSSTKRCFTFSKLHKVAQH